MIKKLEANKREPSMDTVINIAKFFKVSSDYLLGLKEDKMEESDKEMKNFSIIFYNRFACQTQLLKVNARNRFHAGRLFYKKHDRKSYHACIENIIEG